MFTDKRYVNRDVESLRDEIYNIIKSRMTEYTDFNSGTFESHMIDIIAGVADMIAYYIDNAAQEGKLMLARQPRNILGILETMNYQIDTIGPAMGKIRVIRLQDSFGQYERVAFKIPKWTPILSNNNREKQYLTTEDCWFHEDDMIKEIPVVQGVLVEKKVTAGELKRHYKYYVTDENVPCDYTFLGDSSWEHVADAFQEIEGGKKYSVHKDNKGRVYLMFTYDWREQLPDDDDTEMYVYYMRTLGTAGLVNGMYLNTMDSRLVDENGFSVSALVEVYNPTPTYGAFDSVDFNLHRANAMRNLRTMDRYILLEDFEAAIKKKPWVLDCTVYDWRRDITIVDEPHKVDAWVVTVDLMDTNQEVLDDLRKEIMEKTVEMTDVTIHCAEYVPIDVEMNVCVKGNDDYREDTRAGIEQAIREQFAVTNLYFGQVFTTMDFEDVATRYASTVRFPEVTSFSEPYILTPTQFPIIESVKVHLVGDNYGQKTDN